MLPKNDRLDYVVSKNMLPKNDRLDYVKDFNYDPEFLHKDEVNSFVADESNLDYSECLMLCLIITSSINCSTN
ncbi:hypothetical protein CEXT_376421 [Caerostris extrusa]|uniref:Uncharacterized protein n=1 Tax=Caerostris extrusa TaxID=172846 RepID=A0AAV4P053_CAEEX|nr:hypothetical protein CEXT_376421 [Caerostris extrusa]